MNEEVPQDLITVVLMGSILSRPVLLSSRSHQASQLERHAVLALSKFTATNVDVFRCNANTSWLQLSRDLELGTNGLVIVNANHLSHVLQQNLASVLERSAFNRRVLLIRTRGGGLHRSLCKVLLLDQFIDYGDVHALQMVSLPEESPVIDPQLFLARADKVSFMPEVSRYLEDILLHIRTHRLVRKGVSPRVCKEMFTLSRLLCVFAGINYATPVMIKAAGRLVLPLKIEMCAPEDEPSLQYGGDLQVVKRWMRNYDSAILVESILENVPVPI